MAQTDPMKLVHYKRPERLRTVDTCRRHGAGFGAASGCLPLHGLSGGQYSSGYRSFRVRHSSYNLQLHIPY